MTWDLLKLPLTTSGMQYLSVFADRFSKGVVLDPVGVDSSTPVIAKCLVDSLICQHGAPTHPHTDNDPRVTNSLFEEMCKLFGIKHTLTSPDHAQSDGQTERMNENVVRLLRLFIADGVCTDVTWDTVVKRLQFLIESSVNSTTGKTPHRMATGRDMRDSFLSPLLTMVMCTPNIPCCDNVSSGGRWWPGSPHVCSHSSSGGASSTTARSLVCPSVYGTSVCGEVGHGEGVVPGSAG